MLYVEAKLSKFILMMPKTQVKNQESSKFQESKNLFNESKFQESKSRSIKIQIKNQEKTQLR